jgi:hypothetical protein
MSDKARWGEAIRLKHPKSCIGYTGVHRVDIGQSLKKKAPRRQSGLRGDAAIIHGPQWSAYDLERELGLALLLNPVPEAHLHPVWHDRLLADLSLEKRRPCLELGLG